MRAKPILVLFLAVGAAAGCVRVGVEKKLGENIDQAINELSRGVDTFDQAIEILDDLKGKLDDGSYKNQVEGLIRTTGQVGQLSIEGSLDFTRNRIIEDLENMKRRIAGQEPLLPRPVLASTDTVRVGFDDPARSTVTIVGWNLHVAAADREKYTVTVHNPHSGPRQIGDDFIAYQGQYAVTVNLSSSGFPLLPHDSQIVFDGYEKPFAIVIVGSWPQEQQVVVTGELYVMDYEVIGRNERANKPIDRTFTVVRGTAIDTERLIELRMGGEIRATVDLSLACAKDGQVSARFDMKLYEGVDESTTDLDGWGELKLEIPVDESVPGVKKVTNTEEKSEDYMELKITVQNHAVPVNSIASR